MDSNLNIPNNGKITTNVVPQTTSAVSGPQESGYARGPEEEKKPKVALIISILFFLIAVLYGIGVVRILGVLLVLNNVSSTVGLKFLFLRDFPTLGLITIIYAIVALAISYMAIKIRNGSKFSFWLGIILLSFLFIPLSFVTIGLLLPLYNVANGNATNPAPLNILDVKNFLTDPALILYFLIFLLLIASFKKFHFENTSISGKSKIFLAIITIVLIVPTISILTYGYLQANDKNYGYSNAQSKVGYHLYQPSYIPQGLVPLSFSNGKEMADKNNAVLIVYAPPINRKAEPENIPTPLVLFTQVQVDESFDLNAYISSKYKNTYSTKQVPLAKSKNQQAVYLEKKATKVLMFVTNDNVLIHLTAINISLEDLMQMAESLK